MKKILGLICLLSIIASQSDAQTTGYDPSIYGGNKNIQKHDDPLFGLSSNPWDQYSETGAIGSERVSTPWNSTTYYPTPPTDKYIGGKTTWGTAQGQTEIAPEANIYNMIVMTKHLESLGYQIPPGFIEGLAKAPAHYHDKIMNSLNYMSSDHGEPISRMSSRFIEIFEGQTGFSIENLIGTSIGIIGNQ